MEMNPIRAIRCIRNVFTQKHRTKSKWAAVVALLKDLGASPRLGTLQSPSDFSTFEPTNFVHPWPSSKAQETSKLCDRRGAVLENILELYRAKKLLLVRF